MKKLTDSTGKSDSLLPGNAGFIAAGGLIGAILASSCCIVPFLFLTLGISGAWIGNLTILAPYQPYFLSVAIFFLGAGFWKLYRRPVDSCGDSARCAPIKSGVIVKCALWMATVLVVLVLSVNFFVPL